MVERLITTFSASFVNLSGEQMDAKIAAALGAIGRCLDVDRCSVALLSAECTALQTVYGWSSEGLTPPADNLTGLRLDNFPWWRKRLERLEVLEVTSVESLVEGAERRLLQTRGIRSLLAVPMVSNASAIGVLTLSAVRTERRFSVDEIALLQTIAQVFVNALERKRAIEALRANDQRFRALIEYSAEGAALVGADGTLRYVSPAGSRMFGRPFQANVGHDVFALMHPDDVPRILQRLGEFLQQPDAITTASFRYRHEDGSWRWIECTAHNLLAEASVQAIVCNYRDITESKQAEEALRRQLEFVSHDLRAQLRAIQGCTDALRTDNAEQLDESGRRHVQRIGADAAHMGPLIDELVRLARSASQETT